MPCQERVLLIFEQPSPVDRSERAMRETLRIAPRKHTAQDVPGTTVGTWGDLRVSLISGSRMIDELFSA